jgi:tetratricopeptide (TPR) repeat protein
MRYTDENITLIMLSNKSHPNFDRLNIELSRIVFEKNYIPIIPIADNDHNQKYTNKIIDIVLREGIKAGKEYFKKRPGKTNILEYKLNTKGYDLLFQKKYEDAIVIFLMNVFAFPKSANGFDSLGEAYMIKGDKTSAINYYEKSLVLDPTNGNASEMIKKLKQ